MPSPRMCQKGSLNEAVQSVEDSSGCHGKRPSTKHGVTGFAWLRPRQAWFLKFEESCGQRHRVLCAAMDDKLRIGRRAQCAEDVPMAPARRELLARQFRVAPAQPVAGHARCVPDVDGCKPPVAEDGFPAGGDDPSCYRAR